MVGIVSAVLDALFPRFCVACKQEGALLCLPCTASFYDTLHEAEGDHFASLAYGNATVRTLIKLWKYDFDQSAFYALRTVAEATAEDIRAFVKTRGVEVVAPIPVASRRFRERGFNQAEILAAWVGNVCDLPVKKLLTRKEDDGHQAERTDEERKRAMDVTPFVFRGAGERGILLVDDVWTTGATMGAARAAILAQGERSVSFYTLAKGR